MLVASGKTYLKCNIWMTSDNWQCVSSPKVEAMHWGKSSLCTDVNFAETSIGFIVIKLSNWVPPRTNLKLITKQLIVIVRGQNELSIQGSDIGFDQVLNNDTIQTVTKKTKLYNQKIVHFKTFSG